MELPLIKIKKTVEESGCEVGENHQEYSFANVNFEIIHRYPNAVVR